MTAANFTASQVRQLEAFSSALGAELARYAALTPEERRAENHANWVAEQRYQERYAAWAEKYNAQVDRVNAERGRRANERRAEKVRAQTCMKCFQIPAANGECGC
ncbi:hypothetical protein [Streptomyces sp. NPDC053560]|uniref:hypothetical protein n=1 Tax=Streptomyces sp. NPDC053560 TaxID=3365711 RepID=UPI0037CF03EC